MDDVNVDMGSRFAPSAGVAILFRVLFALAVGALIVGQFTLAVVLLTGAVLPAIFGLYKSFTGQW